ncbi:hypothetical protein M885DRAFT_621633 [Pelagophyceae sp. CCMP2097]|nr:hypothetical protein M885DRAFT_621633 [Pelagophyceae sp. CCMP2097]
MPKSGLRPRSLKPPLHDATATREEITKLVRQGRSSVAFNIAIQADKVTLDAQTWQSIIGEIKRVSSSETEPEGEPDWNLDRHPMATTWVGGKPKRKKNKHATSPFALGVQLACASGADETAAPVQPAAVQQPCKKRRTYRTSDAPPHPPQSQHAPLPPPLPQTIKLEQHAELSREAPPPYSPPSTHEPTHEPPTLSLKASEAAAGVASAVAAGPGASAVGPAKGPAAARSGHGFVAQSKNAKLLVQRLGDEGLTLGAFLEMDLMQLPESALNLPQRVTRDADAKRSHEALSNWQKALRESASKRASSQPANAAHAAIAAIVSTPSE